MKSATDSRSATGKRPYGRAFVLSHTIHFARRVTGRGLAVAMLTTSLTFTAIPTMAQPPAILDSYPPGYIPPTYVPQTSIPSNVGSTSPAAPPITSEPEVLRVSTDGTLVSVPGVLQDLLRYGGVPSSVSQLRLMESQQARVAQVAATCTVSVQIGPAQGCGVIITESGFILTAAHVAMRPGKIALVTLSDGRTVRAKTLGMDRSVDAGLMKIESNQNGGRPWPHASLGTSDDLVAGMWCIATGHPGGYDADRGPVTRVGRILRVREGAIETDCALIGGDSGGPLFDISGRLVAVHSRIGNDVAENLHVPVDYYGKSWDRMRDGDAWGFLPGFQPRLGVVGKPKTSQAIVETVRTGSPAEDAGIKEGDIIEQFGEVVIRDFESLQAAVADTMPGERVSVWLSRAGSRMRLNVEVGRSE
ncbi:S1C family serine protease [Rubripirellula tenax]|uniref:S1C family serine protease n=1 Tax=Rubripirellula tenax TaxID=2528015 RepID=UPI001FEAE027|nr:trypsin-like peptidase domain-containing protein [Rubripirellula tenax]